jgi:hypothetical protein
MLILSTLLYLVAFILVLYIAHSFVVVKAKFEVGHAFAILGIVVSLILGTAVTASPPASPEPSTRFSPETTAIVQPPAALPLTPAPVGHADPLDFVRAYFLLLNNRRYQEAYSKLSVAFKQQLENEGGYAGYVTFWNTVSSTEITRIEISSEGSSGVYVYTEITYQYKSGATTTGHTTYKLILDSSGNSWLFDPN